MHPLRAYPYLVFPSRSQEQASVASWIEKRSISWGCVTPHSIGIGGKSRGSEYIFVFDPPPEKPGCVGVAIQIKRIDGGIDAADTKRIRSSLESNGWYVIHSKGATGAIRRLRSLGYG